MPIVNPLISIIMPVYNGERFIAEAINSVINQTHQNWELFVINDGSTDNSKNTIYSIIDPRIKYFEQENKGVSSARNVGLNNMIGDYFCFLDADDVYPPESLQSRINVFTTQTNLSFVDGSVNYVDENLSPISKTYYPSFKGMPIKQLLKLSSKCFFGNTWMIKRSKKTNYNFNEDMKYLEDIYFYLSIAKDRYYSFTQNPILEYRQRKTSAMKNIGELEKGYIYLIKIIRKELRISFLDISLLKLKITKIMILSYLFNHKSLFKALNSPIKILSA